MLWAQIPVLTFYSLRELGRITLLLGASVSPSVQWRYGWSLPHGNVLRIKGDMVCISHVSLHGAWCI